MKLHVLGAAMFALLMPVASTYAAEPIEAIPVFKPKNPAMVELGKKLYFDPRLSKSGFHLLQLLP
jgi:cytochrome c peroxidase